MTRNVVTWHAFDEVLFFPVVHGRGGLKWVKDIWRFFLGHTVWVILEGEKRALQGELGATRHGMDT